MTPLNVAQFNAVSYDGKKVVIDVDLEDGENVVVTDKVGGPLDEFKETLASLAADVWKVTELRATRKDDRFEIRSVKYHNWADDMTEYEVTISGVHFPSTGGSVAINMPKRSTEVLPNPMVTRLGKVLDMTKRYLEGHRAQRDLFVEEGQETELEEV